MGGDADDSLPSSDVVTRGGGEPLRQKITAAFDGLGALYDESKSLPYTPAPVGDGGVDLHLNSEHLATLCQVMSDCRHRWSIPKDYMVTTKVERERYDAFDNLRRNLETQSPRVSEELKRQFNLRLEALRAGPCPHGLSRKKGCLVCDSGWAEILRETEILPPPNDVKQEAKEALQSSSPVSPSSLVSSGAMEDRLTLAFTDRFTLAFKDVDKRNPAVQPRYRCSVCQITSSASSCMVCGRVGVRVGCPQRRQPKPGRYKTDHFPTTPVTTSSSHTLSHGEEGSQGG
jgi:hypothetical protein